MSYLLNDVYRNPDAFRFRITVLPENLTAAPHSAASDVIILTDEQNGDPVRGNVIFIFSTIANSFSSKNFTSLVEQRLMKLC